MSSNRGESYQGTNEIAYLADFPGARREDNVVITRVDSGDIDITNDATRILGIAKVSEIQSVVEADIVNGVNRDANDNIFVAQASQEIFDVAQAQGETFTIEPNATIPVSFDGPQQVTFPSAQPVDTGVIQVNSDDPLEVTGRVKTDDAYASDYELQNMTVRSGEIWHITSNKSEEINNLIVDGKLSLDGTLYVLGSVTGSGTVLGDGEILQLDVDFKL